MGRMTSVMIQPAGPSSIFPIPDHAAGRVPNRVFCIGCQLLGEISLTLPGAYQNPGLIKIENINQFVAKLSCVQLINQKPINKIIGKNGSKN
jgi:hypothetical protein